jgi:hypothetical protein
MDSASPAPRKFPRIVELEVVQADVWTTLRHIHVVVQVFWPASMTRGLACRELFQPDVSAIDT